MKTDSEGGKSEGGMTEERERCECGRPLSFPPSPLSIILSFKVQPSFLGNARKHERLVIARCWTPRRERILATHLTEQTRAAPRTRRLKEPHPAPDVLPRLAVEVKMAALSVNSYVLQPLSANELKICESFEKRNVKRASCGE